MASPIRVFYSELSGRFYASAHYRQEANGVVITGKKYDVTNDIGAAVTNHGITFTHQPALTSQSALPSSSPESKT